MNSSQVLSTVNKLGACEFSTEKLSDLEIHKPYKIQAIKVVNTCFGRRIVVELEGIEGVIYLPERFKGMSEDEVEVLTSTQNICLIYKGKKTLPNGRMANEIEFIVL